MVFQYVKFIKMVNLFHTLLGIRYNVLLSI